MGGGGDFSWEMAGIPLHALCLVSIQSVSIRAVCIRCTYEGLAAKRICYCFKYCTPYSERQNVYN